MKYLKLNHSHLKAYRKYYFELDKLNARKYYFFKEHGTGTQRITLKLLQRYIHDDIWIDWYK
jgi:hypothetical protein